MATLSYVIVFFSCIFSASFAKIKDDNYSKILDRIESLEREQRESRSKIESLEHTVNLQSKLIQSQTGQIKSLNEEILGTRALLQQTNRMSRSNSRKITALRQLLLETDVSKRRKQIVYSDKDLVNTPNRSQQTTRSKKKLDVKHPKFQAWKENNEALTSGKSLIKRQEQAGVSFSVYLDHDLDLGAHQTIKFNQVIINDGNGYNINTGVFTCPESGVYLFSFFIGERSETSTPTGEYAQLMVNDQLVIDAVVDTYHPSQDLQGGNTVIKRLKQGDAVWIGSLAGHVEGQPGLRISTFSGVYLYP